MLIYTSDGIGLEDSLVVGDRPLRSAHDSVDNGSFMEGSPELPSKGEAGSTFRFIFTLVHEASD